MANIISDETIEYVGILAKLELNEEEDVYKRQMLWIQGRLQIAIPEKEMI